MKQFYIFAAKKNRKMKPEALKFKKEVDEEVRDLLLNEYMNNVCRRYWTLKVFIY
jgi:hypothetical protein